jgi:surface carbohydrate biosynthesis protein (TIGR04326 family)
LNITSLDTLLIWDRNDNPPNDRFALLWNGYQETECHFSLLKKINEDPEKFREDYLKLIYDYGELIVDGKRIIEHLELQPEYSLYWMSLLSEKSLIKSKTVQNCVRLISIKYYLNLFNPKSVSFFSSNSSVSKAIEQLCINENITYKYFPHKNKKQYTTSDFYKKTPYFIQGPIFLFNHIIKRWPLRNINIPKWFSGKSSIFIFSYFFNLNQKACSSGYFYSRQWESFPGVLENSGKKINWIHHYLSTANEPDISIAKLWLNKINKKQNLKSAHIFLDSFLSIKLIIKTIRDWIRTYYKMIQIQKPLLKAIYNHPNAWLWSILEDDWYSSVYGKVLMSNILWFHLIDKAISNLPKQHLGLFLCENMNWEYAFIYLWRKHGHGRLIAVPHSTINYWDLRFFDQPQIWKARDPLRKPLPDLIAVNGNLSWNSYKNANQPMDRMVKVEALRYLHLEKYKSNAIIREFKKPIQLLVLGDIVYNTTNSMLKILDSAYEHLNDAYQLIFKPHPANPIKLDNYSSLKISVTNDKLDLLLQKFDGVICSIYTSASIEALSTGLPVITFLDNHDLNYSPLCGVNDACFVSSGEEFVQALKNQYQNTIPINEGNYYWTNPDLPRWKKLLEFD